MVKMRTSIFSHEINKIKLFCKHADDGFVVVEVNDLISKQTIINELAEEYEISYLKNLNINRNVEYDSTNSIFIVDTFQDDIEHINFRHWAININYNRDVLAGLGCIIFICTSRLVNELISFSNSFWSFVALHITLNKKLDCVYSPIYIEIKNQYHFHRNYKDYSNSDIKAKRILNSYSVNVLKKLLNELWDEYGNWFIYYKRVKDFGDYFYVNQQYVYSKVCFDSIADKVYFDRENLKLKIDIMNSLASVNYQLKNYHISLEFLNEIRKLSESNEDYFSKYEIASLWNNIGVLLLQCGNSPLDEVLSCFDEGLNIINFEETSIVISEILYNACIVNYMLGDYNQSKYYIDLSMQLLRHDSRFHSIVISRFSLIKSFIMLNEGDFSNIVEMMSDSLSCLRNELNENHIYILEAHYTFALIYMHLGLLDKAEKCITKALKSLKVVKPTYCFNICVWALYGIVQYYLGNYNEAKNYLSLVSYNSKNINVNMLIYVNAILKDI